MADYSREHLIEICEKAIVPVSQWDDRDTPSAQQKVGRCWALLKAGCKFEIDTKDTDEKTIYLKITAPTFNSFEHGDSGYDELQFFYLPTQETLESCEGEDWY